jgi:hypothetical protein
VAEMTRCTSISPLGSEFDSFLFAPIGEDRNGMLLSVLSALARLDVDPWQEADELARLPRDAATQRLALLIAALPGGPTTHPDLGTIADRLIALLPRRASSNIPSRDTSPSAGAVTNSRIVIFVIIIAFMLSAQYIMGSRQPPRQVDTAAGPASGTFVPQIPPPTSGQ